MSFFLLLKTRTNRKICFILFGLVHQIIFILLNAHFISFHFIASNGIIDSFVESYYSASLRIIEQAVKKYSILAHMDGKAFSIEYCKCIQLCECVIRIRAVSTYVWIDINGSIGMPSWANVCLCMYACACTKHAADICFYCVCVAFACVYAFSRLLIIFLVIV